MIQPKIVVFAYLNPDSNVLPGNENGSQKKNNITEVECLIL